MSSTVVPETAAEITAEIPVVPAAQEQPTAAADAAGQPVLGAETAPTSLAEHSKQWADKAGKHWTPPDIWNNPRPSLKTLWVRARYGEQLPDDETMRTVSAATAVARFPFLALFAYLSWVFEANSRVAAAAVLVLVVVQAIFHPFF